MNILEDKVYDNQEIIDELLEMLNREEKCKNSMFNIFYLFLNIL